jgi:hypothetical protein
MPSSSSSPIVIRWRRGEFLFECARLFCLLVSLLLLPLHLLIGRHFGRFEQGIFFQGFFETPTMPLGNSCQPLQPFRPRQQDP